MSIRLAHVWCCALQAGISFGLDGFYGDCYTKVANIETYIVFNCKYDIV